MKIVEKTGRRVHKEVGMGGEMCVHEVTDIIKQRQETDLGVTKMNTLRFAMGVKSMDGIKNELISRVTC